MTSLSNISIAWCEEIVRVLISCGVNHAFISPGYRDAPFAAALKTVHIGVTSCFDERSAAFQALGYTKHSGKPSMLICTSGTAVANYLPAVAEAHKESVPLVVLSCDRPIELVRCGANQTINQLHTLKEYCKESFSLPCPEDNVSAPMLGAMLSQAMLNGLSFPQGVVHINVPLRAPLEPVAQASERLTAFTKSLEKASSGFRVEGPELALGPAAIERLECFLKEAQRGIVLVGRLDRSVDLEALQKFLRKLSWPVYADVTSGLKYSISDIPDPELPVVQRWLEVYRPDSVLHLGRRLVTKYWDQYLLRNASGVKLAVLSPATGGQNPSFSAALTLKSANLRELNESLLENKGLPYQCESLACWQQKALKDIESQHSLSLPKFASLVLKLSDRQGLFLGNSSSIRAFDTWTFEKVDRKLKVESNRGVSGIDGLLSTAIGVAQASDSLWDIVLGDISFLHDLNALFQASMLRLPLRIFVINNGGGQIFQKLPISQYPDVMNPLITTPHSFDFEGVARSARVCYSKVVDVNGLKEKLVTDSPRMQLIEVVVDSAVDLTLFEQIKAADYD